MLKLCASPTVLGDRSPPVVPATDITTAFAENWFDSKRLSYAKHPLRFIWEIMRDERRQVKPAANEVSAEIRDNAKPFGPGEVLDNFANSCDWHSRSDSANSDI